MLICRRSGAEIGKVASWASLCLCEAAVSPQMPADLQKVEEAAASPSKQDDYSFGKDYRTPVDPPRSTTATTAPQAPSIQPKAVPTPQLGFNRSPQASRPTSRDFSTAPPLVPIASAQQMPLESSPPLLQHVRSQRAEIIEPRPQRSPSKPTFADEDAKDATIKASSAPLRELRFAGFDDSADNIWPRGDSSPLSDESDGRLGNSPFASEDGAGSGSGSNGTANSSIIDAGPASKYTTPFQDRFTQPTPRRDTRQLPKGFVLDEEGDEEEPAHRAVGVERSMSIESTDSQRSFVARMKERYLEEKEKVRQAQKVCILSSNSIQTRS